MLFHHPVSLHFPKISSIPLHFHPMRSLLPDRQFLSDESPEPVAPMAFPVCGSDDVCLLFRSHVHPGEGVPYIGLCYLPCHHSDPGNISEGKILIADQGSLADFCNETLLSLMCDIRKGNLKNAVGAVRHIAIGKIAGNHGRIAALCPQ